MRMCSGCILAVRLKASNLNAEAVNLNTEAQRAQRNTESFGMNNLDRLTNEDRLRMSSVLVRCCVSSVPFVLSVPLCWV